MISIQKKEQPPSLADPSLYRLIFELEKSAPGGSSGTSSILLPETLPGLQESRSGF